MKRYLVISFIVLLTTLASYTIRRGGLQIPRTWDEDRIHSVHLPLVDTAYNTRTVPADYYYRLPMYTAYRTYPVYLPGREPKGYFEWLQKQEAAILFNEASLKSDEDWVKAGEIIFRLPVVEIPIDTSFLRQWSKLGKNWERIGVPVTDEGIIPYFSIVVRENGRVTLGAFSCAMCHTKVMDDGSIILGAQGNYPFGKDLPIVLAYGPETPGNDDSIPAFTKQILPSLFKAPWINHETQKIWENYELEYARTIIPDFEATIPGVMHRHGSMIGYPTSIPDLFDLKDRKYFDRTGLMRHRDIGDLMRYAAFNQGLDFFNRHGDFAPRPLFEDPAQSNVGRYSDTQLYALSRFIYSMKAPVNPNPPEPQMAEKGKQIFNREGCVDCHTPPLYTSNRLTPAAGFSVPPAHFREYDIYEESLETDPGLALYTRRGTGYYKIPSLRHAWNRTAFLHGGYCATLEEMFDKRRLQSDYRPSGYMPANRKTMAVVGHKYGLDLSADDKKALIAFIKSL